MNLSKVAIVSAVFVLYSSFVVAQPFIEIDVIGAGNNTDIRLRAVFDPSAAPTSVAPGSIVFEPVVTQITNDEHVMGDPVRLVGISEAPLVDARSAELLYSPTEQLFALVVFEVGGTATVMIMRGLLPAFNAAMTSLPDNPDDYLLNSSNPNRGMSLVRTSGPGTFVGVWTHSEGFVSGGAFTASVRAIDDPSGEECLVDLNGDGELDFFDVSVFLQLFAAGCP